ncbi:MAG TPA: hypothetical protein VLQ45_28405 [Thermoanaerobaculia bacterium]|nr:hypothetical protein [Thermoanaerobaculia bacterium]
MSSKLRSTAVALVLALVTATAAQALPLSFQVRGGESLLESAWGWLASLFLPHEHLSANVGKAGGMMDPDGDKAGGMMDPNGLTTEAAPIGFGLDAGGMMDPDGLR